MVNFKDVRENLIDMLEDLDEHLDYIGNDARHLNQATTKEKINPKDDELLDSKENESCSEIEKIKKAISDINSGTFGVCLDCGNPIKKEHLNKVPFAKLCNCCTKKSGIS